MSVSGTYRSKRVNTLSSDLSSLKVYKEWDIRELMQQDGWKTQDGRMTKKVSRKIGNAQSRPTFFHHSAVLSVPAVLLHKLPICRRLRKRLKCSLFAVWERAKNSRGVWGDAPPENLLNSVEMHRRVCHLSFKPCLLGASIIMVSLSLNTRNKKSGRTLTDWTLAEVQCQWRNKYRIHEHFWKLKR